MSQTVYKYFTGNYFSKGVRVGGWITTILAFLTILGGSFSAWVFLPVGFVTHFTRERTEFNLQQMTYREAVCFGSLAFGRSLPLPGFDFLFLKKNNYRQTLESRGSMSEFKMEKFDGYLKLANGVKLHLLQTKAKDKAMQQMEQIAQDLDVELRDLTDMSYY